MSGLLKSLAIVALLVAASLPPSSAAGLQWIQVSGDGQGFTMSDSGERFVPWGFNYDHEGDGKLLEDYWDDQWPTVESAFGEMKELGANVVRIHLQFGKFMRSPTEPRQHSLDQLRRLLQVGRTDRVVHRSDGTWLLPQTRRAAVVRRVERTGSMEGTGSILGSHCQHLL